MKTIITCLVLIIFLQNELQSKVKSTEVQLNRAEKNQTFVGFGASLAYYENWLIAHPNKAEIYNVIFNELSLDIVRLRNTFGYDAGMFNRAKEFAVAAENSLGHPIDILVTSWGPPAYLKSNNDSKNGGTLKYAVENGKVNFDYAGFAAWWKQSLDEYKAKGIIPKYISIQNEPDFSATWESCLLKPTEIVNQNDTIAGYNKALHAVYDTLSKRENPPLFLGPECVGIGYNAVENYINQLDLSKLHGIAHHLYHGAESGTVTDDPFTSVNYKKVGDFHPEVPHFQTEYSRKGWFTLAGMIFQSLAVENVSAFFYWDLIWSNGGLVNLHFPWDRSQWTNAKGFNRTKDFYVFKHYSAFIHPGWQKMETSAVNDLVKICAFSSSAGDSAAFVAINRSLTDTARLKIMLPGFDITKAISYTTTEENSFTERNYLDDTLLVLPPKSVVTLDLRLSEINTATKEINRSENVNLIHVTNYPNPFTKNTWFTLVLQESSFCRVDIFDMNGRMVYWSDLGYCQPGKSTQLFCNTVLKPGMYFYRISTSGGQTGTGKMIIE